MKRRYIILAIALVIIATMGAFAIMNAKYAKDDKINAGINELIRQTEIDAENKISAIDEDIRRTEKEDGNNAKVTDLLKTRFDVESNRIGRAAALHQMPGIIKYNDLESYIWNIREGFLNRSDFERVGLAVPEKWTTYKRSIETKSAEK